MATIKTNFGVGGANIPPSGAGGTPTIAQTLRDIADDLSGIQPAESVAPAAVDLATVLVLAEELRTIINAVEAVTLLTIKG